MSLVLWIKVFFLSWFPLLPQIIQKGTRAWRTRTENLPSTFYATKLFKAFTDVTVDLHVAARNVYISLEKQAKKNERTASLWDHHLKDPLNGVLQSLKVFSQRLRSYSTNTDMSYLLHTLAIFKGDTGTKSVSRGVVDFSSEVQLLGDFPVARGVFSSIWLGEIRNNRRVAVKLFLPNRAAATQDFLREAHTWSRAMHHENVMPLLGIAQLQNSVALVSPWMQEGDLKSYLKTHPSANRVELLADVGRGLAYIHSQGIVYGNLRSSTVLVSDMGRAYLSSFLFAHFQERDPDVRTDGLRWRISSPEFFNPHSLLTPAEPIMTTSESDVFAFGTTVIETLTDRAMDIHYRSVVVRNILQGKLPQRPRSMAGRGLTDDVWLLVNNCWQRDPSQRPTMAEVARRMVRIAEAFTPLHTTNVATLPRVLKDVSAEIKKLGEHPIAGGGYCDLYLGERLGSEKVALKLVRLFGSTDADKDAARRRFLNEARIWAGFEHPRILEFYGICEYGTMALFMVSPFLSNGNIMNYLSNVNPNADRRRLLLETAEGLLYIHSRHPPVIHGDLKGANILISDAGNAVLADFGLSRISHETTATMLQGAGSPRWMAPELILAGDEETGPLKTQKSDVYAYGHIMLEVLGNRKPFFNMKEDLHVIVELLHGRRSPRPHGSIADVWLDDSAWEYCQLCTAVDPDDRPGVETVVADLCRLFS